MNADTPCTLSPISTGATHAVTLAQFKADHEARKAAAAPIMAAVRRGDLAGVKTAQAAMRKQFPK